MGDDTTLPTALNRASTSDSRRERRHAFTQSNDSCFKNSQALR
jgi:hypothetical protein